jgi:phage-related protein
MSLALASLYKNLYIGRVDDKPLIWMGSSLEVVRAFPEIARKRVGYELHPVERGLNPSD